MGGAQNKRPPTEAASPFIWIGAQPNSLKVGLSDYLTLLAMGAFRQERIGQLLSSEFAGPNAHAEGALTMLAGDKF
jgi:hypothetical protein